MGLRESINQRPRLVTAVTVGVIVLSLIAIVLQQRALPSRGDGRGAPYDVPDDTDRPVGDDATHPTDRRPAAAPGARVTASPPRKSGRARATTRKAKTETIA